MNAEPMFVVSTTLVDGSTGQTSTLIAGNVMKAVCALKVELGKTIYGDAGNELAHTVAKYGLVDENRPLVYSPVLGGGK